MPNSVDAASPSEVLPYSLATAFQQSREWLVEQNLYRSGEVQRSTLVSTSRRRWALTKRLSAAEVDALRTFFNDRRGALEEFYFYDVFETSPRFSYDDTGSATAGRYVVRFDGDLQFVLGLGRTEARLALIQVA